MAGFWLTALGVFVLDRVVKILALVNLRTGETITAIQGVLQWRLTRNDGVALGLLSGSGVLVIVLPILLILLGWWILRRFRLTPFMLTACALVVGGFAGNLLDRFLYGYVVDMAYFPWMPWYICNLADIAICAGVAMLVISLLARPGDWTRKTEAKASGTHYADHDR